MQTHAVSHVSTPVASDRLPTQRITFQYRSTLDATLVGGSEQEPLTVIYSFDSRLQAGSGPLGNNSPFLSSYGPIEIIIELGGDTVTASGPHTGITVFSSISAQRADRYELRATSLTGSLFARNVDFFCLLLTGEGEEMFADLRLPLTPRFAESATSSRVSLKLMDSINGPIDLGYSESQTTPVNERKERMLKQVYLG